MPIKSSRYSFLNVTISLGVIYISGSLEKHGNEAGPEYELSYNIYINELSPQKNVGSLLAHGSACL